jgi:chorismate synthase
MSTFGNIFKITTFGESHSKAVGVVVDNFPSNFAIDFDAIQTQLNRRKPGQSDITTPRSESDTFTVLSGTENGKSLGSPICFMVPNQDTKPEDYKQHELIPRPSHADFTYLWKYGIHAASGGGRSSARETIGRVIGGALAEQILKLHKVEIIAYVSQIGDIKLDESINKTVSRDLVDKFKTRCPDEIMDKKMEELILDLKNKGDSVGGKVSCVIRNCPRGLGEPVFNKLEAELARAMLSIPATKGFEIGSGFKCVEMNGSKHNDPWLFDNADFYTETNNNGGVIGGISNGEDIYFSVAFKPPATILMDQKTSNLSGDEIVLKAKGRHDPCVVPRAIPIVESMAALVLLDLLYSQVSKTNYNNSGLINFNK